MTAGGWRVSFPFLSSFCLVAMGICVCGGIPSAFCYQELSLTSKDIDLSTWEGVGLSEDLTSVPVSLRLENLTQGPCSGT